MPRDGFRPARQQQQPSERRVVGLITTEAGKLQFHPTTEKGRSKNIDVSPAQLAGAKEGDIIVAMVENQKITEVKKILGTKETPGILSLVSLYEQGDLSSTFNQAVLKETENLTVPELDDREDLRSIPLVTVDGDDSRDFDDAIYAEKKPDGGYHLIVAIADVSYYVRPGSELDKEAMKRGTSTYFPDGVVPMLPEALSNGLCSLKPHEDRAVMVYHLDIDKDGNLINSKINRGLMRSAARITYDELQAAKDGKPSAQLKPLMDTVVNPLYDAYEVLKTASEARGKMNLHTDMGTVASHYVIEEFMVLANVAGDQALPVSLHRYHPAPPAAKLADLAKILEAHGLKLPDDVSDPRAFKPIIDEAKNREDGKEIISAITRSQSKAVYDAVNDGHYGLALPQGYGHHTSPIRRYADLINHRLLTESFNLGAGAISSEQKANLQEIAAHITQAEILSTRAERNADERFAVDALVGRVGDTFKGKVTGVSKAGAFVRIKGKAGSAEGLVQMRDLPDDFYTVNKQDWSLVGRDGHVFKKGDEITVRLKSADGLTKSISLKAVNDNAQGAPRPQQSQRPQPFRKNNGPRPQ